MKLLENETSEAELYTATEVCFRYYILFTNTHVFGELCTAEEVEMYVFYRLRTVFAAVVYYSVTVCKSQFFRNLGYCRENIADYFLVAVIYIVRTS